MNESGVNRDMANIYYSTEQPSSNFLARTRTQMSLARWGPPMMRPGSAGGAGRPMSSSLARYT